MSNTYPFTWITSQEAFDRILADLTTREWLVIDTEFVRVNTFYPNPGLIQLSDGRQNYLIDPLKIISFDALSTLFSSNVLVVMHSMSEDLEVFRCLCGSCPNRIFDTQIALGFLGMDASMGYQRLIQSILDIDLPKGETRSNWLQRPLTNDQITYAVQDVHYLGQAFPRLAERLKNAGRYESAIEESVLSAANFDSLDLDVYYQRIRGAWDLDLTRQKVIKHLAVWREGLVRKLNCPRGHAIDDAGLIQIATRLPKDAQALWKVTGIKKGVLRRYGDDIIRIIQEAHSDHSVIDPIAKPLGGQRLDLYRLLRKEARKIAAEHNLAPELLAKKRILERLTSDSFDARELVFPATTGSWRRALYEPSFTHLISGFFNQQ